METAVWFLGLRGSNICLSTWKYQRRNPHKTRENETISSASDFGSSERIFLDSLYNRSYCSFKCFNMLFFIFLIGSEPWITRLTNQGTENLYHVWWYSMRPSILYIFAALIHCVLGFQKSNYWIANSLAWIINSTIQQISISDLPNHM